MLFYIWSSKQEIPLQRTKRAHFCSTSKFCSCNIYLVNEINNKWRKNQCHFIIRTLDQIYTCICVQNMTAAGQYCQTAITIVFTDKKYISQNNAVLRLELTFNSPKLTQDCATLRTFSRSKLRLIKRCCRLCIPDKYGKLKGVSKVNYWSKISDILNQNNLKFVH